MGGGGLGAALGGAAGFLIGGGPAGAMIGAQLGGAIGGADDQRRAADQMADAQRAAAGDQQAQARISAGNITKAAAPTDYEINQLDQAAKTNENEIARKQKILDSADPALIEAGHQALNLMQGQSAAALGPIQRQRAMQRQQLQDRLRKQLGNGAETSSVGQQALQRFDLDTSDMMNTAQQQTLNNFLNVSANASNANMLNSNITLGGSLAGARGNIASRETGAASTAASLLQAPAGAQHLADMTSIKGGLAANNMITGGIMGAAGGLAAGGFGQNLSDMFHGWGSVGSATPVSTGGTVMPSGGMDFSSIA